MVCKPLVKVYYRQVTVRAHTSDRLSVSAFRLVVRVPRILDGIVRQRLLIMHACSPTLWIPFAHDTSACLPLHSWILTSFTTVILEERGRFQPTFVRSYSTCPEEDMCVFWVGRSHNRVTFKNCCQAGAYPYLTLPFQTQRSGKYQCTGQPPAAQG